MRAIILAAGSGTRLAPLTDDRPKALVEVRGRPIIGYAVDTMLNAGLRDINIVTGYRSDAFRFPERFGIRYFHNPRYAETNMLTSLFCAEEVLSGDVVVSYGDIVYEPRVLRALLDAPGDIAVIIDDGWLDQWKQRNEDPIKDAETLRLDRDGYIVEIGAKPKTLEEIQSQYIGLIKFSARGIELLKSLYHEMERADDGSPVFRGRTFAKLFFTDMLQLLADRYPRTVRGVRIDHGWFEVDTTGDHRLFDAELPARNRFCDLTAIPPAP